MKPDLIVEEIHRIREKYAERFNGDRHAICEDLREKQAASGRKVVTLPPRKPVTRTAA